LSNLKEIILEGNVLLIRQEKTESSQGRESASNPYSPYSPASGGANHSSVPASKAIRRVDTFSHPGEFEFFILPHGLWARGDRYADRHSARSPWSGIPRDS